MAAIGLAVSFGLMIVYFNPWYLFIEGVNAALIVGIVWLIWPPRPWSARERHRGKLDRT